MSSSSNVEDMKRELNPEKFSIADPTQFKIANQDIVTEYPWIFCDSLHDLDKQREFVEWYRRVVDFRSRYIDPVALELDAKMHVEHDYIPRDILEAACDYGLYSCWLPAIVGGAGVSNMTMMMIAEQLAIGCLALCNLIFVPGLAIAGLIASSSSKVFMPFLNEIARREKERNPIIFALAITESSGGTDVQGTERLQFSNATSKCKKVDGGYLLNGTKIFISDGAIADYILSIFWQDPQNKADSCRMFFIPVGTKGLTVGRNENKMGVKACSANEILYEDCFVADKYLLQPLSEKKDALRTGFDIILGLTRTGVGSMGTGAARSALSIAANYAQTHKARGRLLIEHDWVKHKLVKMWKNVLTSRALAYTATMAQKDFGLFRAMFGASDVMSSLPDIPDFISNSEYYSSYILKSSFMENIIKNNMNSYPREYGLFANDIASNVKVTGSEMSIVNARLAMEICGGDGARHDLGIEKIYRDGKLLMIYEGANQLCDLEIYQMSGGNMTLKNKSRIEKKKTFHWYDNIPNVIYHLFSEEVKRGSLLDTVIESVKAGTLQFSQTDSFSDLLKRQALENADKIFLHFQGRALTFSQVNLSVNQFANHLTSLGLGPGRGMGIMMQNSPEFLYAFYASQRIGMYTVPINNALVDEGLKYIINHSEIEVLFIDEEFLPVLKPLLADVKNLKKIFVKTTSDVKLIEPFFNLESFHQADSNINSQWRVNKDDISTVMYTSGTTGLPKGVTYRYGQDWLRKFGLLASLIYNKDDILYTCLPLFHANALFVTMSSSLWMGLPVVLSKKFSASKFWHEINEFKATSFNAIGAMIPILIKQPIVESNSNNSIRLVVSAACPAEHWQDFEERFGLTIWEAYGAVDGGGKSIVNLGNAPVGSIGKPLFGKIKIEDEEGNDAAPGVNGELLFESHGDSKAVEYFHNEGATNNKVRDGYIHTGDLVYRDEEGFIYFVGRKTESMRRRGENVSAFEVEKVILQHPAILECAAYGVPSELGEDDIMCSVVLVSGSLEPQQLLTWLQGKLASFAIPRYVRIMKVLPKTGTHRVIKKTLIDAGVTTDTYDGEQRKQENKK